MLRPEAAVDFYETLQHFLSISLVSTNFVSIRIELVIPKF